MFISLKLSQKLAIAYTIIGTFALATPGQAQVVRPTNLQKVVIPANHLRVLQRENPTINKNFTIGELQPPHIECTRLPNGSFICGCGTTELGKCLNRYKQSNCHYEADGDALCDEDISDE